MTAAPCGTRCGRDELRPARNRYVRLDYRSYQGSTAFISSISLAVVDQLRTVICL